jgi:hypothetical protein
MGSLAINKDLEKEVNTNRFLDENALLAADYLSDLFPHPEPKKKTLHIVIRLPPVGGYYRPVLLNSVDPLSRLHGR